MATFFACPIDGCLPADNGLDQTKPNNVVNANSDSVVTASGVIGSAVGTTVIVNTAANFANNDVIQIPTRNETMVVLSGGGTTTLTVARASTLRGGVVVPNGTASAAIAVADVILHGFAADANPPHCPICGSATAFVDQAGKVNAQTGVATASQVPANVDLVYRVQADSTLAQVGTVTTRTGSSTVVTAGFTKSPGFGSTLSPQGEPTAYTTAAGSIVRGYTAVTPETLNSTLGP